MADQSINSYGRSVPYPARGGSVVKAIEGADRKLMMLLFFASILLPVFLTVGPFSLPPYRLLFLFTFFPTFFGWISLKYGKIQSVDVLIVLFAFWSVISFFVVHGVKPVFEQAGFTVLETLGAYFLGRALVRNAKSFLTFVKLMFGSILLMLPLALLETQTGDPLVIRQLKAVLKTHPIVNYEPRMGLERAQVLFQHPIIFGIYCASAFGLVLFALRPFSSVMKTAIRSGIIVVATFCSVSSGALMAVIFQVLLMAYDGILKKFPKRWTLFGVSFLMLYILVDVVSDASPFHVFIRYLVLDPATAFNRIRIFELGSVVVADHPIFGNGLNDWPRPQWMSSSIDNFWLVIAMRHGYPGFLLLLFTFIMLIRGLSRRELNDPVLQDFRRGILFSLGAILLSAATVYIWGPYYIWLMFFAGASVWLLEANDAPEAIKTDAEETTDDPAARSRYSRFPVTSDRRKKGTVR